MNAQTLWQVVHDFVAGPDFDAIEKTLKLIGLIGTLLGVGALAVVKKIQGSELGLTAVYGLRGC